MNAVRIRETVDSFADFPVVRDAVLARSTSHRSPLHGLAHWRRVATIGRELVSETPGADPTVVTLFALLHDAMRLNDLSDFGHGARGAALAVDLRREGVLDLDDERASLLELACRTYTDGRRSGNATVACCYDADRLDLRRLGIRPNARFLSTEAARKRA